MTSEWLRAIWPELVSAAYSRIVRIDPCSGIGSAINIGRPKHDFCESRKPGTHTCRLRANNIFDRIVCRPSDDSSARIGFNRGREKAERKRRLARRGEHLEGKIVR